MRYQGSKTRIIKPIKEIIETYCPKGYTFVDMFMGGANVVANIDIDQKIGNDINPLMVELWNQTKKGNFNAPQTLTREEYNDMKHDALENGCVKYPKALLGYVSCACSFGGGHWNGYAGYNPKKNEDHIKEAFNGFNKQVKGFLHLSKTKFTNRTYEALRTPLTSFIYCDPPYRNTKGYRVDFDYEKFDNFVRREVKKGKIFLISEYEMPNDFVCIWSKDIQNSMKPGASDKKCEKLFVHISQLHLFNKQYRLTA
jgi:DNA adenine methylase